MNKKLLVRVSIFLLTLTLIVGCSSLSNNTGKETQSPDNNKNSTTETGKQTEKPDNNDSKTELISNIMDLAKQGKVINCEFPAKTTNMSDVENKWGKADNTAWVAAAKGTYSSYSEKDVAFGWNKGMQIFEVRSFDSRLKNISLADLKDNFGTPAYDTNYNGQEIIGYTADQEYKLLFVLAQTTDMNSNPVLDHYSVLYPPATENSMAGDPGRQW